MTQVFPGSNLEIYGSQAAGLALPDSDIDLMVITTDPMNPAVAVSILKEELTCYPWVAYVTGIETASVPVVKLSVNAEMLTSGDGKGEI